MTDTILITSPSQGPRGPQGISGPTGTQGPPGPQGLPGSIGPTAPPLAYAIQANNPLALISSGTVTFQCTSIPVAYQGGERIRASSRGVANNYMEGIVLSLSASNMTVSITHSVGSGTYSDWNINIAGDIGASGTTTSGMPVAGTAGQYLIKNSSVDYDVAWATRTIITEAPIDGTIYARQNATWVAVGTIPAGSIMLFWQAAAPVGWTKVTTHNDKALRVVSGAGGVAGGTNPFSTVMAQTVTGNTTTTTAQTAGHFHTTGAGIGYTGNFFWTNLNIAGGTTAAYYGTSTNTVGGDGAHSHPMTMAIQYIDLILASKN